MRGLAKAERSSGATEFIERQKPKPGAGEVLVEVGCAGLYGSSAGVYEFESAFERMDLPTVIGHEYASHVVEVGNSVTEFGVDDRVVERPIRGCGECYQCHIGEGNVCQGAVITDISHDGACERFIVVPGRALHPIPDDAKQQCAAVAEPTNITACAVVESSRVGTGDRVLVEGPGPIGLLTAQVVDTQGGTVAVSGVGQDAGYRLPPTGGLGFETVNVADDGTEVHREHHTGGVGYDVVFDTTGHPSRLTTAVDEVRKGDQVALVGQTGKTPIPYSPLIQAEIDLQCSYASMYEDFERSFRLIRDGDVDCETFVSTRFSLFKADETFEALIEGGMCKSMFDISELA